MKTKKSVWLHLWTVVMALCVSVGLCGVFLENIPESDPVVYVTGDNEFDDDFEI